MQSKPADGSLEGGCLCGAIRYAAHGTPWHATICHCETCRRAGAAPAVAWFTVERAAVRITRGEPKRYRSSAQGTRSFCGDCGTQLFFENADLPREIDVSTCSLDDPARVPPQDHTYLRSRIDWQVIGDALPRYDAARG